MAIFETERLLIRELNHEDIQLILQYSKEETKRRELPDEVFDTTEKATGQVEMCLNNYREHKFPLVYGIVLKETNTLIGDILLCPIKEGIEIGYFISENYQCKGYATEAISAFAPWAKNTLHLDLIYGLAKKSNVASWRALEKAGFEFIKEKELHFFGSIFTFKVYTY